MKFCFKQLKGFKGVLKAQGSAYIWMSRTGAQSYLIIIYGITAKEHL